MDSGIGGLQRQEELSAGNGSTRQSEFGRFIGSQIMQLISEERERNAELGRERELAIAIDFCKKFLAEAIIGQPAKNGGEREPKEEGEEQRERHREEVLGKLVQLNLELERHKELMEMDSKEADKLATEMGHEFTVQSAGGRNSYCEACMGTIWRLAQRWRRCKVCGFRVHEKCLGKVRRICAGVNIAKPDFSLLFQLCPEQTLRDQNYKCAECTAPLSYDEGSDKVPRLCDYTGHLYCSRCHWNDYVVIPARLVRNWDTEERLVCRATKQLFYAISRRPLIDVAKENPLIFKFVHSMNKMQKLRSSIMFMKCYFISCKDARKLRILQYLHRFQHFVENDFIYSLDDLVRISSGQLLPEIEQIVNIFRKHITEECELCRGNAFFCELCSANERIFPFSDNVAICKACMAVYHRPCFDRVSKRCPRCARRRARRKAALEQEEGESGGEEEKEEKGGEEREVEKGEEKGEAQKAE